MRFTNNGCNKNCSMGILAHLPCKLKSRYDIYINNKYTDEIYNKKIDGYIVNIKQ